MHKSIVAKTGKGMQTLDIILDTYIQFSQKETKIHIEQLKSKPFLFSLSIENQEPEQILNGIQG
jgi:hypothetical protein